MDIKPVIVSVSQLVNNHSLIGEAFGSNGLILVKVPNISQYREKLLSEVHTFANSDYRHNYTMPEYDYSIGWSEGKEQFNGKPDQSKGSFYLSFSKPIFPIEQPILQKNFLKLASIMQLVGELVIKQSDKYFSERINHYTTNYLEKLLFPLKPKARMLNYYPNPEANWCGWHYDHGMLTSLISPIYFDSNKNIIEAHSSLLIRDRNNIMQKINLPDDCIAFQVGEALQIISGGLLKATPHAVLANPDPGLSRTTMALFLDPGTEIKLKTPVFTEGDITNNYDLETSAPLKDRWNDGIGYNEYSAKTYAAFKYN
jgi:isopenicillin N synthase-like dioxygenase